MESIADQFYRLKEILFRSSLGAKISHSRFRPHLADLYWWIVLTLANNIVTYDINDVITSFHVQTRYEYVRFRDLVDEANVIQNLLETTLKEDVVYDIGANVGTYTCCLAQTDAEVHAIEPHPINLKRLGENLKLNDTTASVHPIALSDTSGQMHLTEQDAIAGAGQHALDLTKTGCGMSVEIKRGDEFAANVGIPDILKIDVEGAELRVLEGFGDVLSNCRAIFCEVHPEKIGDFGDNPEEVSEYLLHSGFNVQCLSDRDDEFMIKAVKNH